MVVFPGSAAGSYGRGLRARHSVWVDTPDHQLSVWCEESPVFCQNAMPVERDAYRGPKTLMVKAPDGPQLAKAY
jgi:hypothetical protein